MMDDGYPVYCMFVASLAFAGFAVGLFANEMGWALGYLSAGLFCAYAASDD
jgi:hypothetical protein